MSRTSWIKAGVVLPVMVGLAVAAAGDLDTSFGTGGVVLDQVAEVHTATAVDGQGRIVCVGASAQPGWFITRYLADGSLDSNFGSSGRVTLFTDAMGLDTSANDVAVLPDGDILVCGNVRYGRDPDLALARLNSDGSLDTSYGATSGGKGKKGGASAGTGYVMLSFQRRWIEYGRTMEVRSDGKVIVGGSAQTKASDSRARLAFVACVTSAGALDTSFGSDGVTLLDYGDYSSCRDLALDATNRVVIQAEGGDDDWIVARLTQSGQVDTSFNSVGYVVEAGSYFGRGIAVQSSGKIVACGRRTTSTSAYEGTVIRYNANGTHDGSFGTGGVAVTGTDSTAGYALVSLDGGGVLMVTEAFASVTEAQWRLYRFSSTGSVDLVFDDTDFEPSASATNVRPTPRDLVLDGDGGVIAVGQFYEDYGMPSVPATRWAAVARWLLE